MLPRAYAALCSTTAATALLAATLCAAAAVHGLVRQQRELLEHQVHLQHLRGM